MLRHGCRQFHTGSEGRGASCRGMIRSSQQSVRECAREIGRLVVEGDGFSRNDGADAWRGLTEKAQRKDTCIHLAHGKNVVTVCHSVTTSPVGQR